MRTISKLTMTAVAAMISLTSPLRADPPLRVGRVSATGGMVSVRPAGVDDWTSASLNYPITSGDALWADTSSRAELHIGSSAVRVSALTSLEVLVIDDHRIQLRLAQGTMSVRVRSLDRGDVYEIDTPRGAVTLHEPGLYRIDADSSGSNVTVTVRRGDADIMLDSATTTRVRSAQEAEVFGDASPVLSDAPSDPSDGFDAWVNDRDRREDQALSTRYVSREMTGYEELDGYGSWRMVPGYGNVWVPTTVVAGWAPYRYGHWVWVSPWGWTWVDDAPWGFAPFHYGRWAYIGGGWAWVPGVYVARPVYAPALVAFVGGPHWGASVSFGAGVAWFPLAPNEPYIPVYHVSPTYVRTVNVTSVHVTNINVTNVNVTNVTYVNRSVTGAVTSVPERVFTGAQPVGRAAVVVPSHDVERAAVIGAAPAVAPRKESIVMETNVHVRVAQPSAVVIDRPVVARTAPPAKPVPWATERTQLESHPGRPVDPTVSASQPAPARTDVVMAADRAPHAAPAPAPAATRTVSTPKPASPVVPWAPSATTHSASSAQAADVPKPHPMPVAPPASSQAAEVPKPHPVPVAPSAPAAATASAVAKQPAPTDQSLERRHVQERAQLAVKQERELQNRPPNTSEADLRTKQQQERQELHDKQLKEHQDASKKKSEKGDKHEDGRAPATRGR
ncbi:MAG TPA: DUF6600 domain-containing protein [Gemmatimonadaceae bacterium]|nr:DUF6600 domain-containing protein [Gemmatimonadaceae bacterium]